MNKVKKFCQEHGLEFAISTVTLAAVVVIVYKKADGLTIVSGGPVVTETGEINQFIVALKNGSLHSFTRPPG